jgi:hypothetical protein
MALSEAQKRALPSIIFRVQGEDGFTVDIKVPSSSYIERIGPGAYVGRVFLTERAGAVLGMTSHSI